MSQETETALILFITVLSEGGIMSESSMVRDNCWLSRHAGNVTSQRGEDGIISQALKLIGNNDGWCVEFGAWDGKECSNTYNLIVNKGYSSVLIEGDSERYAKLVETYRGNSKVIPVNKMVGFEACNNLDVILAETQIPLDFDFLSIDIDGNDYHVWDAITRYRPKLLAIEYNPTIPNAVAFVQPKDMNITQGSSIKAIVNLCKRKGYELVATTDFNGIFIDSRFYALFGIKDNSPEVLRLSSQDVTYIFSGYDGTVFLAGSRKLPWHDIEYDVCGMQQVPSFLRKYPPMLGRMGLTFLRLYRKWCRGWIVRA